MARTRTYDPFDIGMEYLLTASFDECKDFDFDLFMDNLWRKETDIHTSGSSVSASATEVQCQSAAATLMEPLQPTQQPHT